MSRCLGIASGLKERTMRLSLVFLALTLSAPVLSTEPALHDREPQQQKTTSAPASAKPVAAPEIDLAGAPAALALLAGSIAILSGRRRQRC